MGEHLKVADLFAAKQQGRPVAAVSCYDYTTARLVARTPVELVLVGDSAAQALLGFESTLPATMDFMVAITAAVGRGAPEALLVADMPFLSYHVGIPAAVTNAGRFVVEAGAGQFAGRWFRNRLRQGRRHLGFPSLPTGGSSPGRYVCLRVNRRRKNLERPRNRDGPG